jgi:oligo-1,6-glucosidase
MSERTSWWKEATIYQIYPRSFNDSNGDGVGDIPGIVKKLDYLDELGIDAVWLSPVYGSPDVDNGYDVSNYREIAEEYGTMADFDRLLDRLHNRGIKLIMDLVINHTSDEHEWFVDARQSIESEYREYYFWRPGNDDMPPNNWRSLWGGSAWTHDEATGEHYLHLFHEKQADLDWDNPDVREDLFNIANWWLDKGIDGFRLDSINLISKPDGLPDADLKEGLTGLNVVANGPQVAEHLQEFCRRTTGKHDAVTIGEMPELSVEEARRYVGDDDENLSMLLNFEHVELDRGTGARWAARDWTLPELKEVVNRWQRGLEGEGWQGIYFNNHDQPRAVSRLGDDETYRRESATMLATMIFTLRGTPLLYQGEEIGMTNPRFESFDEIRDIATIRSVEHAVETSAISDFEEVKDLINARTRDNARTPMQWSDASNGGFTNGDPWIKVNDDYKDVNVTSERDHPNSIWAHYRDLIALRDQHSVLVYGKFRLLLPDHPQIFSYLRTLDDERILVVLNFSTETATFRVPDAVEYEESEVLSHNGVRDDPSSLAGTDLEPYEAGIYRLL